MPQFPRRLDTLVVALSLASSSATAQTTWTSTTWHPTSNWSTGQVPTTTDDVLFAVATNQPSITSMATYRGLLVPEATTLTAPFDLAAIVWFKKTSFTAVAEELGHTWAKNDGLQRKAVRQGKTWLTLVCPK